PASAISRVLFTKLSRSIPSTWRPAKHPCPVPWLHRATGTRRGLLLFEQCIELSQVSSAGRKRRRSLHSVWSASPVDVAIAFGDRGESEVESSFLATASSTRPRTTMSLDEAMLLDLDFAGAPPGMDVAYGFGFDFDFDFDTAAASGASGGFDFDTTECGAAAGTGSGTTSPPVDASTKAGSSGVDDDDEEERLRRLKRKISNRESARRSRARRRQQAEDLERAAEELRAQRRALAARRDAAAARALAVRLDNARLGAEAGALRRRLREAQRQAVLLLALARAQMAPSAVGIGGGRALQVVPPQPAGGSATGMMTS
uniref:BZIP domain-containing protein n=2 Tax=Setaria italica TaxID=4555 RepID=K4A0N9_SETIT